MTCLGILCPFLMDDVHPNTSDDPSKPSYGDVCSRDVKGKINNNNYKLINNNKKIK